MNPQQPCSITLTIAAVLAMTGCATPQAATTAEASAPFFHCTSTSRRFGLRPVVAPPPLPPVTDGAVGRLEVKLLDQVVESPSAPKPDSGTDRHNLGESAANRLSLIAEGVPVGQVAVALAEALGVNVFVEPAVLPRRIFVHAPDTTLGDALGMMGTQACLSIKRKETGLHFLSSTTARAHWAAFADDASLKMRYIKLPPTIFPRDFAAAYCAVAASPDGEAAVVGDTVLVKDTLDGLVRAEALAARLQGLPVKSQAEAAAE